MHGNFIGIDPDKDYLLDPQKRDTFPGRCDCCGHVIRGGDRFCKLELCSGLVKIVRKTELTVCSDCKAEMELSEAIWEDIRYGA